MLTKFAVTNFRGFSNRIEWDLTHHGNYAFNTSAIKNGIVKNGIIYGPNGCGKSNFSIAIFDIVNHIAPDRRHFDYKNNFAFVGKSEQDVLFEYEFQFGTIRVRYEYSKRRDCLLRNERLSVNGEEVVSHRNGRLEIASSEFSMSEASKKQFEGNVNGASIINYLLASYPLPKKHYLLELKRFVCSMLWYRHLDHRNFIGFNEGGAKIYKQIIDQGLVDEFKLFLKAVSNQEFEFEQPSEGDVELVCRINGANVPFCEVISTGTHSLALLFYWMSQMGKTLFVFIDEFDAFYHFKLAFNVCRKLFDLPHCQVFLTSHNTYLMTNDLLRPDCNFILKDNAIRTLSENTDKELRQGHNMEKLYRGGAFEL